MEFFIKKNATLPLLKMQVVKDGRSDYNNMMNLIEESAIFFSMIDVDTGIPRIITRPAGFVSKKMLDPNAEPEYYVYYQFTGNDTRKVGRYEGQFLFRNDDGVLILPIRDKLYINIQESFIGDSLVYDSCYVSEFPCCNTSPVITATTTTICYVPPTPTPSPIPLVVTLQTVVTSGSVVIDYYLTANKVVDQNVDLFFDHVLGVYTGSPITISTGVTINQGGTTGTTQVILPDNFDNLSRNDQYQNVTTIPSGITYIISGDTFPVTPTPTPSPTPEIIQNAILTNNDEYIGIGVNEYLSYIDVTYFVDTNIQSGSTITTFSVTGSTPYSSDVIIPLSVVLDLTTGGTITISDTVTIPQGEIVGTKTNTNPLNYNSLNKNGELRIQQPNNTFVNCLFLAYPINFE